MKMVNDFPRRSQIDQMSHAELAIRDAIAMVESLGAHPILTQAVILLSEAKEKVADFIAGA